MIVLISKTNGMKKILLLLFFFTLTFSGNAQGKKELENKKKKCKTEVYICNSFRSKTYHLTKNCSGLKACKDTIRKIYKFKAERQYGRVLCSLENEKNEVVSH